MKLHSIGTLPTRLAQPGSPWLSINWPFSCVALTSAACCARVLRDDACDRRVWSRAAQERSLSAAAATTRASTRCMQKEKPHSIKVRPRTAIERAASLSTAAHVACTTADDRIVRLRPLMTQAVAASLAGRVE